MINAYTGYDGMNTPLFKFSGMAIMIVLMACVLALGACGVKPSQLERPGGPHEEPFPATYPKQ